MLEFQDDQDDDMIGIVRPYKPQNDAANSQFKIEDVTDDPRVSNIYCSTNWLICAFSVQGL